MHINRKSLLIILVCITLVIGAICLFTLYSLLLTWPGVARYPIISTLVPVDNNGYTIGQNFSAQETDRIIDIAFSDPFITGAIWEIGPASPPDRDSIVCVTTSKFLDFVPDRIPADPEIPRYKILPIVIIRDGDPDHEGINTWIYVDTDRGYVPYIGYVVRPGIEDKWVYSNTGEGVQGTNKEPVVGDTVWFRSDNLSIAYTGYVPPDRMTDEENEKLVSIALNDKRVKSYLSGYEYKISEVHSDTLVGLRGPDGYYLAYPCINFLVMYEGKWEPLMKVDVDLAGNRITAIDPYYSVPSRNVRRYEIV